jgi:predicted phage terminase large subunit-like protein
MLTFPNDFCQLTPHPNQKRFLELDCLEAFFGGAAGGGKSAALLMAALQYADVPGYSALIVRKDTQRLALSGGLIPRSHEWFANSPARWNEARRRWSFPTKDGPPATLTFGYLSRPSDKFRYASSEFQYIAFDELTELREEDYLFLFSRLRRTKSIDVKLRIRSASNPGNSGHLWVKERFVRDWSPTADLPEGMTSQGGVLSFAGRAFVPSLIADNPSLERGEYLASLGHLPPLTRERLACGDWSVQEKGQFRADWFRYFILAGEQYELLGPTGTTLTIIPQQACRRFATVDPAGTSADLDADARNGSRSFSVVQVWDQPRPPDLSRFLILRDQQRDQVSINDLCKMIRRVHSAWRPERIWIEQEKLGHSLVSMLANGTPTIHADLVPPGINDKATRAAPLANKMERGEVFLPKYNCGWRQGFERELLAWTGSKREPSDQIDAAAYAAIVADSAGPGILKIQPIIVHS